MHRNTRRIALRNLVLIAVAPILPAVAADKAPVAIKGYDPVAYFKLGKPVRGKAAYEVEWDERRYRFVSAAHRDLFKADPIRYAPQFSTYCAMSLAKGEIVESDPESWLISDGRLYLFGKKVGPQLFQQALADNVRKADQHRDLVRKQ